MLKLLLQFYKIQQGLITVQDNTMLKHALVGFSKNIGLITVQDNTMLKLALSSAAW